MKYSLSAREILRANPEGFLDLSNNTDILNNNSSINLTEKSIFEELILLIALSNGQY